MESFRDAVRELDPEVSDEHVSALNLNHIVQIGKITVKDLQERCRRITGRDGSPLYVAAYRLRLRVKGQADDIPSTPSRLSRHAVASVSLCPDARLQEVLRRQLHEFGVSSRHVHALRTLCDSEIPMYERLMAMDRPTFKRLQSDARFKLPGVMSILRLAYLNEGGSEAVVALRDDDDAAAAAAPGWPSALGVWLARHVDNDDDDADRAHLMNFLGRLDDRLQMTRPHRDVQKSRASLVTQCCVLFGLVDHVRRDAGATFRETMPFDMDNAGLQRFFVRIFTAWRRNPTCNQRKTTTVTASPVAKMLVTLIKTATKAGVFPNIVARRTTFSLSDIQSELSNDADEAMQVVPSASCRPNRLPTEDSVRRLMDAAGKNTQNALLLTLFVTTGLRLRAVARITVAHIWDERRREARQSFVVREKNSVDRTIVPCETLRAAIRRFVVDGNGARYRYAFANRATNVLPPSGGGIRKRIARLCCDAGVPFVNPHAFRAYVVTMLRRNGVDAEHVSRFVGHKLLQTQNVHYWKENADAIGADVLADNDAYTVRGLQRRINAARQALASLQARRDRMLRLSSTMSTHAVDEAIRTLIF